MNYAVIYSKENCQYCTKAKMLLRNLGIGYDEFIIGDAASERILDANQHWTTREDLLKAAPHARTVPQIWLNDIYVGGYTELHNYLESQAA